MLDIEFTIQDKKLFMLQCRVGKRTGTAALNMAMDMLSEKLIDEKTAVMRVAPAQLDELLHPILDQKAEKSKEPTEEQPEYTPLTLEDLIPEQQDRGTDPEDAKRFTQF
jgi:phosphoenolpyruvate synthase/pyruvate phosphate dikinase